MHKYKIEYRGKTYMYNGADCAEAADKLSRRKVFGRDMVGQITLKQYDAGTRGKQWAEYITGSGNDDRYTLSVSVVQS